MLATASVPSDELTPPNRRFTERRYAHGELLLAAFIAARRPLTFDDLACVLTDTGARVSDVADWLASAQESRLIVHDGYETGPNGEPVGARRFVLSREARDELRARRSERRRWSIA